VITFQGDEAFETFFIKSGECRVSFLGDNLIDYLNGSVGLNERNETFEFPKC
jgi:hypothetical protein